MPLNVLIAPDKFKGTLSARAAAAAIARGWSRVRPKDALALLPITDGGDGFGEVMGRLLGARAQTVTTVNAAQLLGWEDRIGSIGSGYRPGDAAPRAVPSLPTRYLWSGRSA